MYNQTAQGQWKGQRSFHSHNHTHTKKKNFSYTNVLDNAKIQWMSQLILVLLLFWFILRQPHCSATATPLITLSGIRNSWNLIIVYKGFAVKAQACWVSAMWSTVDVYCCLPGALYTSLSRLSLSVNGAPLTMLWVQLWQIVWSNSVWALVACTVKWGSSKIHSVVGAEDLLLLQEKDMRRRKTGLHKG